jgi:hypothetical protein
MVWSVTCAAASGVPVHLTAAPQARVVPDAGERATGRRGKEDPTDEWLPSAVIASFVWLLAGMLPTAVIGSEGSEAAMPPAAAKPDLSTEWPAARSRTDMPTG